MKPEKQPPEPAWFAYRIHEAAIACRMGKDKIYQAIREGRLPAHKYGNVTVIAADDLRRFIDELPRLELDKD